MRDWSSLIHPVSSRVGIRNVHRRAAPSRDGSRECFRRLFGMQCTRFRCDRKARGDYLVSIFFHRSTACPNSSRPTLLPPRPAAPGAAARCGTTGRASAIPRRPISSARIAGAMASSGHRVAPSPHRLRRPPRERRVPRRAEPHARRPPSRPLRPLVGPAATRVPESMPTGCPSAPSAAARCGTTEPRSAILARPTSSAATSRASVAALAARG